MKYLIVNICYQNVNTKVNMHVKDVVRLDVDAEALLEATRPELTFICKLWEYSHKFTEIWLVNLSVIITFKNTQCQFVKKKEAFMFLIQIFILKNTI